MIFLWKIKMILLEGIYRLGLFKECSFFGNNQAPAFSRFVSIYWS